MKKLIVDVAGMHCKSCELLLEKKLSDVERIEKVRANQPGGTVEISYGGSMPDRKTIEAIIRESGYRIEKEAKTPWFHSHPKKYIETVLIALTLFVFYEAVKISGFSFPGFGDFSSPSLAVAFFVGITAGVSSCMALVG